MTVSNMSIEWGARAGDRTRLATFAYLRVAWRAGDFDACVERWSGYASDPGAQFDAEVLVDAAALALQVTWGPTPARRCRSRAGYPSRDDGEQRARKYMDPHRECRCGDRDDCVFIGSCTNSRLADRAAGDRRASTRPGPRALGSRADGRQARGRGRGSDRVSVDAGFEWRNAGC
jgi:3-isopropylmalate/(R)-2-methylmalate dehydratase large subunit